MGRKRTLADDLADLATSAPSTEVDIDRDELGQSAALVESDEGEEELQQAKRARNVPERGLRMRADIDLENKEYAGKKTTRASVFDQNSDDPSGSTSSEADSGAEGESDDRAFNETASSEEDAAPGMQTASSSDVDDGSPESDGQDAEQVSGDGLDGRRIYSEALDATVVDHMKARLAKDRAKASAAKAQHAIWERLLEMRILLQKALTASHQLPERQVLPAIVDSSADTAAVYRQLQEVTRGTITDLLDMHTALVHQNPALDSGEAQSEDATAEKAGSEAELWQKLDKSYSRLQQFRDSSLDRWYRKALLGSGHLALKGNLRLLNQSVSSQVASMMRNPERLIRRAQLPLWQAPRQLFSEAPAGEPAKGVESDPERFDDSEFYQQLLKEFLEANSSAASMGAASAIRGKKSRNMRDRRASKGRRLRYDVQEKLVNFMVARKYEEPPMASQLFRNLFGQSWK